MTDPTDRTDLRAAAARLLAGPRAYRGNTHSQQCDIQAVAEAVLASPAPSGGQADLPAEPSERELPTPGLWWHVSSKRWAFVAERSWPDANWNYSKRLIVWFFRDDSIADGILLEELPKGHWRPAVPDAENESLRAERDRLRERLEAVERLADEWENIADPNPESLGAAWIIRRHEAMRVFGARLRAVLAERTP
jgi:hypothetical protein